MRRRSHPRETPTSRAVAVTFQLCRSSALFATAQSHSISEFRGLYPNAPVVKLSGVGHFCQEDAPETLVALIQGFMQTHP